LPRIAAVKKCLPALVLCAAFPFFARAEGLSNTFALSLDPVMLDTEEPAGERSEKHDPRFAFEFAHTLWPRLDVFAGAGLRRLRIDRAGVKSTDPLVDLRLGARQYLLPRQPLAWTPFIDGSISDAWLRDRDSTQGGNRRYGGWNVAVGVSKQWSASTEVRFALGFSRLTARETRGDHTDVLSTADLRIAAGFLF
jgi:hypothetical protein